MWNFRDFNVGVINKVKNASLGWLNIEASFGLKNIDASLGLKVLEDY